MYLCIGDIYIVCICFFPFLVLFFYFLLFWILLLKWFGVYLVRLILKEFFNK